MILIQQPGTIGPTGPTGPTGPPGPAASAPKSILFSYTPATLLTPGSPGPNAIDSVIYNNTGLTSANFQFRNFNSLSGQYEIFIDAAAIFSASPCNYNVLLTGFVPFWDDSGTPWSFAPEFSAAGGSIILRTQKYNPVTNVLWGPDTYPWTVTTIQTSPSVLITYF